MNTKSLLKNIRVFKFVCVSMHAHSLIHACTHLLVGKKNRVLNSQDFYLFSWVFFCCLRVLCSWTMQFGSQSITTLWYIGWKLTLGICQTYSVVLEVSGKIHTTSFHWNKRSFRVGVWIVNNCFNSQAFRSFHWFMFYHFPTTISLS